MTIPAPMPFLRLLLSPDWLVPVRTTAPRPRNHPDPLPTPGKVRPLTPPQIQREYPLAVTRSVHETIRTSIGSMPAETGAMLGGPAGSDLITHIHLDQTAATTRATYSPDVTTANQVLAQQWRPAGVELMGFVHSHPVGYRNPSDGDLTYGRRILTAMPGLDRLVLPIVSSAADNPTFTMDGFTLIRGDRRTTPGPVLVVQDQPGAPAQCPYLSRVNSAYDPAVMGSTRVVAVGVGGSVSYLEDMARSGVGEFVLVDPDTVDDVNVGTQHVWPHEVGRPKVEVCAYRLAALNPNARIWTVQARDHDLDDLAMRRLTLSPLPGAPDIPRMSLLCAFTDAFIAQARLSRLALHLGVPFLTAAVYQEGRGSEIAFSAPGITPACTRCALASRYRAYLQEGFTNTVTSHGTPIYVTSRLNALKQVISHALLHGLSAVADPQHPATVRYRRLLDQISTRNLVLTSHDPDIGTSLGLRRFSALTQASDGVAVTDQTVWLQQQPDNPQNGFATCPDCGGTGDLGDSVGTFEDTRQWHKDGCR